MNDELLALTADIVSAHISNNKTSTSDIPALIASTFEALDKLGQPAEVEAPKAEPAVSIRSSIKPRLHRLPRRREAAYDAQALPAH